MRGMDNIPIFPRFNRPPLDLDLTRTDYGRDNRKGGHAHHRQFLWHRPSLSVVPVRGGAVLKTFETGDSPPSTRCHLRRMSTSRHSITAAESVKHQLLQSLPGG
jgi:hypothetical protein